MNYQHHIQKTIAGITALFVSFCAVGQSIHITSGTRMVMVGNVDLVLNNAGFANDGNITAGAGTVIFTGVQATIPVISGNSITSFANIAVDRTAGVILFGDINVNGTLSMTVGNLQLNGHVINLGSTGSISGEKDQSHITGATGRVVVTRPFTANIAQNPGNIGALLQIDGATGANLGNFTVTRRHSIESLPGFLSTTPSIQRNFTVSGPGTGLNGTLTFYYLDQELNGVGENSISMFSAAPVGTAIKEIGADNVNTVGNTVTKAFIDPLAHFTLGTTSPIDGGGGPAGELSANNRVQLEKETLGSGTARVSVYPNPGRNNVTIALYSKDARKVSISLLDRAGNILEEKEVDCSAGLNNISWDISHYAAGVYYLSFKGAGLKTMKIVKE